MVPGLPRLSSTCPMAKTLAYNIRLAKHFGAGALQAPWQPTRSAGRMTAAHLTTAADQPWTCHHSPFRVSRNLTHAVAARLSLGLAARLPPRAARARHRIRAWQTMDAGSFLRSLQLSWKLAATCTPATGRARLALPESVKLLQLRVHLPVRSLQNLTGPQSGTLDEDRCGAWLPAGERGWTKKAEPACVFASRALRPRSRSLRT